ncbi:MAG: hydantoinase/oxoprolinase family protein [Nevskia sp.]|nr:hydantoinase/oxoprolinase family protein [Nevskia sp.]
MGKLINIDNGGTLTDICVIDGDSVYRTKTVTTPYDLSKCFFDGLKKVSKTIYGDEDLLSLLRSTDHIRYSTTQGTNALVERKGPRLGLIVGGGLTAAAVEQGSDEKDLFAALIGTRVESLDLKLDEAALETAAMRAVNTLAAAGANRVVIAFGGVDRSAAEQRVKRILLRKFPPHLLGALPILFSHEVVEDENDVRRSWTALFNAFLHPAMERFLYNAEHMLRANKTRNPLLIFRNDGLSARVAKTSASKTYSSGPRGGAEGAKALAQHYGFKRLLSMDVGGTTTDIGLVEDGVVRAHARGKIENTNVSFPLCDVVSAGVGGSSIIKLDGKKIKVGPESVGGAPGPACFGLGGKEATITDAFLLQGLLDPASYFGGELKIDIERARAAITEQIAKPLGLSVEAATVAMEQAWVAKVADGLQKFCKIDQDTTLAAFGGAGPFVVCKVAQAAGISQVIIPGLAAVFSAFGIGFSDIGHQYDAPLQTLDDATLKSTQDALLLRAERGMFAEGFKLGDCLIEKSLSISDGDQESSVVLANGKLPTGLTASHRHSVSVNVVKAIPHPHMSGKFGGKTQAAVSQAQRNIAVDGQRIDVPLYRAEDQQAGATAVGPAVLEEAFFTCRIEAGWRFEFNAAGDILLTHVAKA